MLTPVLIQTAGDMASTDNLVSNPETQNFLTQSLAEGKLTNYKESRHNIWWETDEIRTPALKQVLTLL